MDTTNNPQIENKSKRVASGAVLAARNKHEADKFAQKMRPILMKLNIDAGYWTKLSPQATAEALNAEGVPTVNGGKWHRTTVRRLLARLGTAFEQEVSEFRFARL